MSTSLQIGSRVRHIGPRLLGSPWTGIVVRLPVKRQPGEKRRVTNARAMVQVGTEKRPRPVRPEDLLIF